MAFRVRLLLNSPLPVFGQIVEQVRQGAAQGVLRPGDRLPTVRELAEELVVNPNTVARAYQELERTGVIATRRGAGSFVAGETSALAAGEKERILTEKIDSSLTEAVHLGLTRKSVVRLFMERLEKFRWTGRGGGAEVVHERMGHRV